MQRNYKLEYVLHGVVGSLVSGCEESLLNLAVSCYRHYPLCFIYSLLLDGSHAKTGNGLRWGGVRNGLQIALAPRSFFNNPARSANTVGTKWEVLGRLHVNAG